MHLFGNINHQGKVLTKDNLEKQLQATILDPAQLLPITPRQVMKLRVTAQRRLPRQRQRKLVPRLGLALLRGTARERRPRPPRVVGAHDEQGRGGAGDAVHGARLAQGRVVRVAPAETAAGGAWGRCLGDGEVYREVSSEALQTRS